MISKVRLLYFSRSTFSKTLSDINYPINFYISVIRWECHFVNLGWKINIFFFSTQVESSNIVSMATTRKKIFLYVKFLSFSHHYKQLQHKFVWETHSILFLGSKQHYHTKVMIPITLSPLNKSSIVWLPRILKSIFSFTHFFKIMIF